MHCTLFWVLKVSYSIIAYQVLELKLRKNSNKKTLESDETGIKQHVEQPRRVSQPSASSAMHRALMRGTWHRLDVHPCRPMSTHGSRPSFPLLPLGLLRLQPPDIKKMYEKCHKLSQLTQKNKELCTAQYVCTIGNVWQCIIEAVKL